ncbi:thiamine pyrophosphate-binding protein [Hydrogenophaga sp. BPS33]|uniref:thiamine pyrophosphate-binding protein n=1 Tax=Hydrogenophaga sp. BPS33 TaxID=2651974 RepID=UPI0013593129|nr:thiamine pyrophosphate-dependent enzyme [Hydrogenophaga sp. BPS33]
MTTRDRIPTYEALALQLQRLGAECVFGLMSDETAMLIASLDGAGVRFIGARHENCAVAMAEGYAAASGRLGIALVGRGPATANALHGIVYARKTGSPVLLMMGAPSGAPLNPNALGPDTKALDSVAVLRAAGVRHVSLDDADVAPQLLAHAYASAHQGAMALLLPMNVLNGSTPATALVDAPSTGTAARPPAPRAAALEAAATQIARARRPLILAGAGAHRAGARDTLVQLAEHLGAVLATTMKAKDMFRGHPFDCGVLGSFSHGAGRRLIDQTDCVIAFGAGLNQRTSSQGTSLPETATLVQVDVSREAVGRWLHCDVGVVGDAREVADRLLALLPARGEADRPMHAPSVRDALARYRPEADFEASHTASTVDPRSAGIAFDRALPRERNVVYDAGNFLSMAPYVHVPGPGQIKQASDFSSIGMGFGTAMGFAHGAPERVTVLFIGDGAFLMTLGELETVAREGIPMVIVVMNDGAYGAELHYLRQRNMAVSVAQFPQVDYAPIAAGFGFQTATVRTVGEILALAPLLAAPDGPIFIDCKINGAVTAGFLEETAPAR